MSATPLSNTQVDRLGIRLRDGAHTESDLSLLNEYRRFFDEAYRTVIGSIRERLHLAPTGRPAKSTKSIVEKLRRESIRLSQMQDIAGCRIVVDDVPAQDRVVESLRQLYPDAAIVDRREIPSHGYRAVHVLAGVSGKTVEIQVRTLAQNIWASLSEKAADLLGSEVKYGGGDKEIQRLLTEACRAVEGMEASSGMTPRVGSDWLREAVHRMKPWKMRFRSTIDALVETPFDGPEESVGFPPPDFELQSESDYLEALRIQALLKIYRVVIHESFAPRIDSSIDLIRLVHDISIHTLRKGWRDIVDRGQLSAVDYRKALEHVIEPLVLERDQAVRKAREESQADVSEALRWEDYLCEEIEGLKRVRQKTGSEESLAAESGPNDLDEWLRTAVDELRRIR